MHSFIHRQEKNLHYAFVDLEKGFYRVLIEVTWWVLRKSIAEEWLVSAVMVMYEGAKMVVRRDDGYNFAVKVGLHQGSVLSSPKRSLKDCHGRSYMQMTLY
jgi:hypothetical protein